VKTRNIAGWLRDLYIHAVENQHDYVCVDVASLDEIVAMLDKVDSLLFQSRSVLNQAIYVSKEVKRCGK